MMGLIEAWWRKLQPSASKVKMRLFLYPEVVESRNAGRKPLSARDSWVSHRRKPNYAAKERTAALMMV